MNQSNKKLSFILFTLLMIIVCAISSLRADSIGNDTKTYLSIYNACSNLNLSDIPSAKLLSTIEIGYIFLNWICHHLFNWDQSILIISSIIITMGYFIFIKKYSYAILFSFFLFFLLGYSGHMMNLIRQSIALVVIFKSYDEINRNNFKNYLLYILIAFLFHKSSICFLPAWWLCHQTFNKRFAIIVGVGTIAAMLAIFVGNNLINLLMGDYFHYMDTDYASSGKIAPFINFITYLIFLLFIHKCISKKNLNDEVAKNIEQMEILLFVGVCILFISLLNALIFRLAMYYYVFIIVLLPNAIHYISDKRNKIFFTSVILILLITRYIIINIYRPDWNHIYPYKFFWEI